MKEKKKSQKYNFFFSFLLNKNYFHQKVLISLGEIYGDIAS